MKFREGISYTLRSRVSSISISISIGSCDYEFGFTAYLNSLSPSEVVIWAFRVVTEL